MKTKTVLIAAGSLLSLCALSPSLRSHAAALIGWAEKATPDAHEIRRAEALLAERAEKIAGAQSKTAGFQRRLTALENELAEVEEQRTQFVAQVDLLQAKLKSEPDSRHYLVAGRKYSGTTLKEDAETLMTAVTKLEGRKRALKDATADLKATLKASNKEVEKALQSYKELRLRTDKAKLGIAHRQLVEQLTGGAEVPGLTDGELEKAVGELERRGCGDHRTWTPSEPALTIDFEHGGGDDLSSLERMEQFLRDQRG